LLTSFSCVADPDPRIRWLFDPGIGTRDEHPESYFRELRNNFFWLKILKFFDADPDPGSRNHFGPIEKFGSGINNKHPGSATLIFSAFSG
jgi:hypothetical protein